MTRNPVIVFGNPDLPMDSLPLRILPALRKLLPGTEFLILDPNEELPFDAAQGKAPELTVLDTVQGIDKVTVFEGLKSFAAAPRLTMHDFDALGYLKYLEKLGKIKSVTVIGIPSMLEENKAVEEVVRILSK